MDARAGRALQSLPRALNILRNGAGQAADNGTADLCCTGLNGGEISIRSNGKSGFDHVDTEAIQLAGQLLLLLNIHAAAGRLLAVTKGGVEYSDASAFHQSPPGFTSNAMGGQEVKQSL